MTSRGFLRSFLFRSSDWVNKRGKDAVLSFTALTLSVDNDSYIQDSTEEIQKYRNTIQKIVIQKISTEMAIKLADPFIKSQLQTSKWPITICI